jgi:PAS domain S-box-containing protein
MKSAAGKTKDQLLEEISQLRKRVEELESRLRSEENLRTSEARYRFLAENMNDIVWISDAGLNITYESPSVEKILGYTPGERCGQIATRIMSSESQKKVADSMLDFLEQERKSRNDPDKNAKMELEYCHKNGSSVWLESVTSAIRDQTGRVTGFYGVSRDVTERKRSEAALQASQAKYRLIADSMNDIIWITDENFIITYVTPSVVRVLGYTPEERIGQSPTTVLIPEAQKTAFETMFRFLEQERIQNNDPNKTVKMELQYVRKNGTVIWMESVTSAIRDETGRVIGFHGAARDINKRKLAEEELQRHREKLEFLVQKRTRELSDANKRLKQENEMRKKTEGSLRYRESQLKKKKQELEEINSTLKILLKQRDEDKASMENNIVSNIKISLLPFLEKLEESGLKKDQELIVKQLRSQIKEITSPFIRKISSELLGLTTSEIQVASLIKAGKSSHEIASIMNVSLNTVITHRYNIRRKTGLKNNKINLCSYLQTLE